MTKKEIQSRVLKNGKELALNKFAWNDKKRKFSSREHDLVLDFQGIDNVIFNTGNCCSFNTGSYCKFDTGNYCTFNTGSDCFFNTISVCTFNTGSDCIFDIGIGCTIVSIENAVVFNESKENVVIIRDDRKKIYDLDKFKKGVFLSLTVNNVAETEPIIYWDTL